MDLLYRDIPALPDDEILMAIYVSDNITSHIATKLNTTDLFKLYRIYNHKNLTFMKSSDKLTDFETFLIHNTPNLVSLSCKRDKDIRLITIVTNNTPNQFIKKPKTERTEIVRYNDPRRKKLF